MTITSQKIPSWINYYPLEFRGKPIEIPQYENPPKRLYTATHGQCSAEHETMLGAIMKCTNQVYQMKFIQLYP